MSAAELFAGAGQKAGIEVWRIEALKPVKNKEAESGRLCTGDSYIVLHSIPVKSGGFDYNLHFWLGEESSQDEKGCAVRALPRPTAVWRLARAARLAPRPSRLRRAAPRRRARTCGGSAAPRGHRCNDAPPAAARGPVGDQPCAAHRPCARLRR
jgi:hypothetical protein